MGTGRRRLEGDATNTGAVLLRWNKAAGAARYDIHRCDDLGNVSFEDAVKVTRWEDENLAGRRYRYYVRAYAASGQGSAPSNSVFVDLPAPDYFKNRIGAQPASV